MPTMQELVERYETVKKECSAQFRDVLMDTMQAIFAKYPDLAKVQWTQYTPYFNDGDPCVFSLSGMYYFKEGVTTGGEMDDGGEYVSSYSSGQSGDPIMAELVKLESQLEKSLIFLEEAIGDHVEVTFTREGIQVEEYDHD